jgi:hypothetical protein
MIKIIAVAVVLVVAAVLILAATRPDTFRVQRSASIQAPPDKVFPLINDLRRFSAWSPYEKKDPNMVRAYSGPAAGPGATYAFSGNKDAGKGTIKITDATEASQVRMNLLMLEPIECDNKVEFTLEPKGDVTQVTWSLQGPVPYMAKIVHLFLDMDKMVGKDFEVGLENLKHLAEAA